MKKFITHRNKNSSQLLPTAINCLNLRITNADTQDFRIVAIGNELKVTAFGSELKVANPKRHEVHDENR